MFDLLPYNTFGLDVKAKDGIIIRKIHELDALLERKTLILGQGSDVLFVEDYDGLAVINAIGGLEIVKTGRHYEVSAGGGLILDDFIKTLLTYGICGLENLSGIPGTVGAAPIQNAGAYGCEIGDYITSVEVYDLDTKKLRTLSHDECRFGYRTSIFKKRRNLRYFITRVNFSFDVEFMPRLIYQGLADENLKDALAIRNRVISLRARRLPDPRFVGNAGSFFKNPVVTSVTLERIRKNFTDLPVFAQEDGTFKIAAGYLVEKAGCRGITHGNAGTWEHQALVIVNRGFAKPHEIVSLARYVAAEVKKVFRINLIPEVRIIGRDGEVSWDQL